MHPEWWVERRGIGSRARPAIASRLIARGRRVHAFTRADARRDGNGIECGECQETGKEPADMRLCPFRKSYPDVMVVQPEQDWDGDNRTVGSASLDSTLSFSHYT